MVAKVVADALLLRPARSRAAVAVEERVDREQVEREEPDDDDGVMLRGLLWTAYPAMSSST
ncbi:hypothetical protein [Jiangella asiatica]|uniref:hypothetical protein n=1 Tax=Jiangella asiatica TaxID=2530372 RepID=UPI001EEFF07B|nr:hypothetical protein [Jiangella asiatica]